jgi:hypothetical protein
MRRIIPWGLLALSACGTQSDDTATRLEHPAGNASDSAIAQSRLPGAGGVRKALELGDTARARRALEDTIPH